MQKVLKNRIISSTGLTMISLSLSGCSLDDAVNSVDVIYDKDTIYDHVYETEDESLVNIDEMNKFGEYFTWTYDNGLFSYGDKILYHEYYDGYDVYIEALCGNLYAINFDNPTLKDKIDYKKEMDRYNHLIYIENFSDEILHGSYPEYIIDGIDYKMETITVHSLKYLIASYIPYNQEEIKNCLKLVKKNTRKLVFLFVVMISFNRGVVWNYIKVKHGM